MTSQALLAWSEMPSCIFDKPSLSLHLIHPTAHLSRCRYGRYARINRSKVPDGLSKCWQLQRSEFISCATSISRITHQRTSHPAFTSPRYSSSSAHLTHQTPTTMSQPEPWEMEGSNDHSAFPSSLSTGFPGTQSNINKSAVAPSSQNNA